MPFLSALSLHYMYALRCSAYLVDGQSVLSELESIVARVNDQCSIDHGLWRTGATKTSTSLGKSSSSFGVCDCSLLYTSSNITIARCCVCRFEPVNEFSNVIVDGFEGPEPVSIDFFHLRGGFSGNHSQLPEEPVLGKLRAFCGIKIFEFWKFGR